MGACVFGWMLCLCVFVKVESMRIVDLRGLWNVSNTNHGELQLVWLFSCFSNLPKIAG